MTTIVIYLRYSFQYLLHFSQYSLVKNTVRMRLKTSPALKGLCNSVPNKINNNREINDTYYHQHSKCYTEAGLIKINNNRKINNT